MRRLLEMKNKLYYRLCRRDENGNLSSWFHPYMGKGAENFKLDYNIGEVTWAPLGTIGIFIFSSLEHAKIYDSQCPGKIIISGEAIEPRRQLVIINPLRLSEWLNSKDWCKSFQELRSIDCAYGLYTCAGFRPIEIVWKSNIIGKYDV